VFGQGCLKESQEMATRHANAENWKDALLQNLLQTSAVTTLPKVTVEKFAALLALFALMKYQRLIGQFSILACMNFIIRVSQHGSK
jgi:hypothetical protein